MGTATGFFHHAVQAHRGGDLEAAERLYRQVVAEDPAHSRGWQYLGVIAYQRGDYVQAQERLSRALQLAPEDAVGHNHLGLVDVALGRDAAAEAAYRQALKLRPDYPDAWSNLGALLATRGDVEQAIACYEQALRHQPRHVEALYNCGNALMQAGRVAEAVARYQAALEVAPDRPDVRNNLGNALLAGHRAVEAVEHYQAALRLRPDFAEAHYNLGVAFADQDEAEPAAASLGHAVRLRPGKPLWALRRELLWPIVFHSSAESDEYRQRLVETLDKYRALDLRLDWDELSACGCTPPFNLPHQGGENLPLKRQFAAVFQRYFNPAPEHLFGALPRGLEAHVPAKDARPRLGVVVTRGHEPMFLKSCAGILNGLPPTEFQVVVFCAPSGVPQVQAALPCGAVSVTPLPHQFPAAVATLRAAACDLQYYWEIGSDALNYFLPFLRLAPVQCTGWGSLVTSGVPQVDYYVSSALVETDESDGHYSERLVRLSGLLSCQPRLRRAVPGRGRSEFGLPSDKRLYVCPQNLMKFHPDFDALVAEILRRDPGGLFVALDHRRWPRAGRRWRERLQRTVPDVADRVILLPWQPPEAYLHVIALADVVLDTPHYGAVSTTYDIFSVNQPMVTLPGRFHIGRFTLACYRQMGVLDLIADSPAQYVTLAVQAATDEDFRAHIKARIAERSDMLFDDAEAVAEHVRFFREAVARAAR